MLLVHVVTGLDLLVAIAQLEREVRIAFEIHGCRHFVEREKRKHFALNLEDDVVRTKRRPFGGGGFVQTIIAKALDVHFPSCR
jgi:hypothetical protein